jgi:hypothetical protein
MSFRYVTDIPKYLSLPCLQRIYLLAEEQGKRSRYSDWLRAGRLRGRSSSPGSVKNFLHVVQTGSDVHPTSYPICTGAFFAGGKAAGV